MRTLAVAAALLMSSALVVAAPVSAAVASAASQVTLSQAEVSVGDSITVEYATDRPTERNWIAIYTAAQPNPCSGCGMAWEYAPGTSGSVTLPLHDRSGNDLPAGEYRIEYLYDEGWTRVSDPVEFTITSAHTGSVLTVASERLVTGEPLEVSWTTDAPHNLNWIGIYPPSAGTPDGNPASTQWQYAPGASGTATFTGLPAGTWLVYFLAQDRYGQLTSPVEVTITAAADEPQPGDPNAPVEIDAVVTDLGTDGVIAREGFIEGAAPEGWTIDVTADDGNDAYRGWAFTTRSAWTSSIDQMRGRFARPLGALAVADAQQFGGALDTTLTGAPVPVQGLAAVRLTFDSHYRGAAGQSGVVRVSFDGGQSSEILRLDSDNVTDGYEARQLNHRQDVLVQVPAGAQEAVFSWQFTAADSARYWAIDNVAVHLVQADTSAVPTQAWVMSDIQGHPHDWQHAIGDYVQIAPDADGMLLVGDIVDTGAAWEWNEIYAVMDATADIRPRQTVAAIGNHERYAAGGFNANRDRFLAFANRDQVWDEYVLEGPAGDLPVIVIGQEFAAPSDVAMSDAQVEFLQERLAHWTAQDRQVLVITHFPLGDTVSASWIPWYHNHHQMNARLTSILGNYPNAIILTGHTHYPADLGDWAVQRRTADGHPDGFWAVNTLAMHVGWDARGENTAGIREVTIGDINQGLTVDSYGDRVVVTAHDFAADVQLRQITIPNPLVPFNAIAPADTTPPTVTVKDDTIGADSVYERVSFKLFDAGKVDKVVLNGVEKDLTDNTWSDLNGVVPGRFGAVLGENTLEVYDVAGNVTTVVFTLVAPDTTAPTVTVKEDSVGVDGVYERVSFKLFDAGKVDKVVLNGVEKDLTDNTWSDLNGVVPGRFGAVLGENTLEVYDVAGNVTTVVFTLVAPQSGEPLVPVWVAGQVYTAGDVVSHQGVVFLAQWWTTEEPGASVSGSWMERGVVVTCSEGGVASWTASQVYTGGDLLPVSRTLSLRR